jgi:CubicO group peptidase (beta-lactamase class C family)
MFIVATAVIEKVTGRKLGDLMREWIWEPLGMDSTFFDLEGAKNAKQDLAKAYRYDYMASEYREMPYMDLSEVSGAGFVISDVLDYAKWARAIMEKKTPLSMAGWEAILTPRTLVPTEEPFMGPMTYALGWESGVYKGERYFGHSGALAGFGTEFIIFPDQSFGVVAVANTAGTANFVDQRLVFHLIDEKLNIPDEQRFNWNKQYVFFFHCFLYFELSLLTY